MAKGARGVTAASLAQACPGAAAGRDEHSGSCTDSTNKPPPPCTAWPCRYADYLLDTISKRELFQWLSLTPARFWHTLLHKDRWAAGTEGGERPRGRSSRVCCNG